MSDILEKHRSSRKSPSVLQHALILVRSARPDALVFVFEGDEDVGVYETWIERTGGRLDYESIAGKGKEQLIALYKKLILEEPRLLRKVYFFVDCDFDPIEAGEHLFVLDGYSIENFLCTSAALDSLLIDEFKCASSPQERDRVKAVFERFLDSFHACAEELHFCLFAARRAGIRVVSKSDDSKSIAEVSLDRAVPVFSSLEDIVEL